MKRLSLHIALLITTWIFSPLTSFSQETVFNGLKSSLKRADKYYQSQSYPDALELYLQVEKSNKRSDEIYLKLARTSYQLNEMEQVSGWYENYLNTSQSLDGEDAYLYAESLTVQGKYQQAIVWLKKYRGNSIDDHTITRKIWQLQNIRFLYNDSSYYEVNPVSFNTEYAEFGAAYFDQELVFVSNRNEKGGVSNIDKVTGQAFQSLYTISMEHDSATGQLVYGKPKPLLKQLNEGLHQGPISRVKDNLIFTKSHFDKATNQSTLQLYWVTNEKGSWINERPFQHNSTAYSLSYPCLSEDGKTLYFISDMQGGSGGNDIYRSTLAGQRWSTPENLGPEINTTGDETAPFIHNNRTLYFASTGHGGFGGLDIFKASLQTERVEVENLGYPINSAYDDFGLMLNEDGSAGYIASNRASGGFNDDLYEVVIDLQSYPLTISGAIFYHDPDWAEADSLEVLSSAKIKLIDNLTDLYVNETTTDQQGKFSLEIPYSSRYKLKVSSEKVGEPTVSLEIPKNKKLHNDHKIVVFREKYGQKIEGSGTEASGKKQLGTGTRPVKREDKP